MATQESVFYFTVKVWKLWFLHAISSVKKSLETMIQFWSSSAIRFKSDFPIFDKIEVNGDHINPLYKFLKLEKWGIFGDDIQSNSAKFLIDKNGQPVDRYYPTSPLAIERDIKKLLGIK